MKSERRKKKTRRERKCSALSGSKNEADSDDRPAKAKIERENATEAHH